MPYETHWEPTGVRWVYSGILTDEDALQSNREVYDDPRFPRIRYQIVDFRKVDRFAASAATVRQISRMDTNQSEVNPHIRVAMVADTDLTRGMASMYLLACGEDAWDVQVFDTVEQARDWLKRQVDEPPQDG